MKEIISHEDIIQYFLLTTYMMQKSNQDQMQASSSINFVYWWASRCCNTKIISHKHITQQVFGNYLLDEEAPSRLDDQLASSSIRVDELLAAASQLHAINKKFNTLCFNHFLARGCEDCTVSVLLSLYQVYILSDIATYVSVKEGVAAWCSWGAHAPSAPPSLVSYAYVAYLHVVVYLALWGSTNVSNSCTQKHMYSTDIYSLMNDQVNDLWILHPVNHQALASHLQVAHELRKSLAILC